MDKITTLSSRIRKCSDICMENFWFYLAAFFLFWEPDYIKSAVRPLDRLFDAGSLVILVLLALFYIVQIREVFGLYDIFLILVGAILLGSTLAHQGIAPAVWKCLKYEWPVAALTMLIEVGIRKNPDQLLKALYVMCYVNTAVNLVCMAVFPEGLYLGFDSEPQSWLGNENVFIVTILAGLCAGYIFIRRKGKKICAHYLLYWVISVISCRWSATAGIGILVFTALFILHLFVHVRWLYSLYIGIGLWAAGFFGITVFRVHKRFPFFFEKILHRDVTLTLRTKLWSRLRKQFWQSPVWGYGVRTAEQFSDSLGGKKHWVHAHSYIMELLNKGGLVLTGVFTGLLLVTAAKMQPYLEHDEIKMISITLLAYFIIFIGDCFEMRTLFYVVLCLGSCSKYCICSEQPEALAAESV